jgi:hypothetical protein
MDAEELNRMERQLLEADARLRDLEGGLTSKVRLATASVLVLVL